MKPPRLFSSDRGGIWGKIGHTALAKVLVMAISGAIGILTSRLIIQNFGLDAYAQYGLLTSLPSLIPFADLGIAALVFNVVAGSDDPRRDEQVRRTIITALRILLISGPVIILVGVAISLFDLWPVLLGKALLPGGATAALLCTIVFGSVLPLTVGQRILVGLGRTGTQVATQLVIAPFILLSVLVLIAVGVPAGSYISVLSYIGAGLVSMLCILLAARAIRPMLGSAIKDIFRFRAVRNVAFLAIAGPNLIQVIILPIATQLDRVLLSQLTVGDELAQYNLASQLFGIASQTIAAAGLALWPIYARARATSQLSSPMKPALVFLVGGLLLSGAMAVLSPFLVAFVSDGAIVLDGWLIFGFIAFVGVQASKYPLGMYMTDARGLRFQILPILIMLPLNIGLSMVLITAIGAGGPIVAGAVSALICQVLPYLWYVRRDLNARRALRNGGTEPDIGI